MIEELPLASWGNIRPLRRKEGQEKMDRPSVLWPEAVDSLFRNGVGLLPHVNLDGKNGAVARRPPTWSSRQMEEKRSVFCSAHGSFKKPQMRVSGKGKRRCTVQINQMSSKSTLSCHALRPAHRNG